MVAPVDDPLASFKKNYTEGCRGEQIINRIPTTLLTLEGLDVCDLGYHRGLQEVQSVMVGPVEDPFTKKRSSGVAVHQEDPP